MLLCKEKLLSFDRQAISIIVNLAVVCLHTSYPIRIPILQLSMCNFSVCGLLHVVKVIIFCLALHVALHYNALHQQLFTVLQQMARKHMHCSIHYHQRPHSTLTKEGMKTLFSCCILSTIPILASKGCTQRLTKEVIPTRKVASGFMNLTIYEIVQGVPKKVSLC